MLSLLSLIIASGTVLRADTELWEPLTYPDPRTNVTQCNTVEGSTLCDPDHILTDTWRQTIQENIEKQVKRLRSAEIPYTDDAAVECNTNGTEPVEIYVILAKRIQTASNQSITSNDLTSFGHGLRDAYGLDSQSCKNYILILGVELAKEIYVWTGSDLAIPQELMDSSLSQFKNLFIERNYMEGLNKIVDEIGDLLMDPHKDVTVATTEELTSEEPVASTVSETSSPSSVVTSNVVPVWIYIVMSLCIVIALSAVLVLLCYFIRKRQAFSIQTYPSQDAKPNTSTMSASGQIGESDTYIKHCVPSEDDTSAGLGIAYCSSNEEVENDPSTSPTKIDHLNDFIAITSPKTVILRERSNSYSSETSGETTSNPREEVVSKVCISYGDLSTDRVQARRNSDPKTILHVKSNDHYSSF